MKQPNKCKNMSDIREAIDAIDDQIVHLIAQRAQYVKAAAKFKKDEQAVKDPERVRKVIATKKELAGKYGASPELIEKLYTMMIDFFISEEMREYDNRNL